MDPIATEIISTERTRDARGHRLYNEERRAELIAAYRQSDLTQAAFARRAGIKYSTFTAWLQKRRGCARPAPAQRSSANGACAPVRFTEVKLPELLGGGLEVRLPDGTCLRGARVRELAELAKALRP